MSEEKEWNVGDEVYAVTSTGYIIKATIKEIHEAEGDWPSYELDIDSPCRFYHGKDLFKTKRAARMRVATEKWDTGKNETIVCKAHFDPKKGTFITADGEEVSQYFKLSDKELSKLKELI